MPPRTPVVHRAWGSPVDRNELDVFHPTEEREDMGFATPSEEMKHLYMVSADVVDDRLETGRSPDPWDEWESVGHEIPEDHLPSIELTYEWARF